jgi:hypothetical protein
VVKRVEPQPVSAAKKVAKKAPSRVSKTAGQGRKPAAKKATAVAAGVREGAGARLLVDLSRETDPRGVTLLIHEAARVADRLERLDRVITGQDKDWLRVYVSDGGEVVMKVDGAIAEERQQSSLYARLLAEIHRQRAKIPPKPPGKEDDDLEDLDEEDKR